MMRKFSSATKWHNGVLSSVLDSAAFKGFEAQAELSSVTKSLLSTSSLTPSTDAPQNGNIGNFGSKRSFASSATISQDVLGSSVTQHDVAALLQTTAVLQFREHLKGVATERPCVPIEEFEKLAKDFGVASSEDELLRITDALSTAGVVLRFRNIVYLRPKEVGSIVLQILPESHLTTAQIDSALEEVRAELKPMEDKLAEIERKAHVRSRVMMYGGLAGLTGQLALYIRLTYYDLSWDVMEPVAYFTSVVFMIMTYTYFMSAGKEYTYEDLNARLFNRYKKMYMQKLNFDEKRYHELLETATRYERRVNLMKFLRAAR